MGEEFSVVEPNEITTPHTHEGQEEVFVARTGGQIAIDDEIHDVSAGGVVRVESITQVCVAGA